MLSNSVEFSTRGYWRGQIAFYTLLPDNDKVMFSDCSYVPYEVTLSDPENFVVDERSSKISLVFHTLGIKKRFENSSKYLWHS